LNVVFYENNTLKNGVSFHTNNQQVTGLLEPPKYYKTVFSEIFIQRKISF